MNSSHVSEHPLALSINMVQDIPDRLKLISCSIGLNNTKHETTLDFICMWSQEYFGYNATITISELGSEMNEKCVYSEDSGLKIENVSPWNLIQSQSLAYCSIKIPNLEYQPVCHFSLNYIEPWPSIVSPGKPGELTCPLNSSQVRWWKISSNGTHSLLHFHHRTLTYDVHVSESEVIFMCSIQSHDKGFVLSIGKIIVTSVVLPETLSHSLPMRS